MASNPWDGVDRSAYSPVYRRTVNYDTPQIQAPETADTSTFTPDSTGGGEPQDTTFDTYAQSIGYDRMPHVDKLKAWEKYRNEILPGVAQQNGYRPSEAQKKFDELFPRPDLKKRGALDYAADVGLGLAAGVTGLAKSATDFVDPSSKASKWLGDASESLHGAMSDAEKNTELQRQADQRRINADPNLSAVGKFTEEAKSAFKNMSVAQLAELVGNIVPTILTTGGVGLAARAAGMGKAGITAATTAAGAVTGAVGSGGDAAGSAYEAVMNLPAETLAKSPEFQALAARVGPDEAKKQVAMSAARSAQVPGTAIGAFFGPLGAEAAIGKKLAGKEAGGRMATAAKEAFLSEIPEEVGTTAAGNYGASTVDPTQRLMQGAGQAAVLAAIGGGGAGFMSGGGKTPQGVSLEDELLQGDAPATTPKASADGRAPGADGVPQVLGQRQIGYDAPSGQIGMTPGVLSGGTGAMADAGTPGFSPEEAITMAATMGGKIGGRVAEVNLRFLDSAWRTGGEAAVRELAQQTNTVGLAAREFIKALEASRVPLQLEGPAPTLALPSPQDASGVMLANPDGVAQPATNQQMMDARARSAEVWKQQQETGLTPDVIQAQAARAASQETQGQSAQADATGAVRGDGGAAGNEPGASGNVGADGQSLKHVVLQNRDREGAASIAQMQQIAARPDYTRVSVSRQLGEGSPVVIDEVNLPEAQRGREEIVSDAAGRKYKVRYAAVEAADLLASHTADGQAVKGYERGENGKLRAVAGNGRVAGLQRAYTNGTAMQYRTDMMHDAQSHGIDPQVIAGMKAPVLVRTMNQVDVSADIGDRTNTTGVSQMSPVEQAKNDARRVDVAALEFTEEGEPTPDSVRRFVQGMPESERGGLMDQGGAYGRQAVDRLMAAVFWKAYGDADLVQLYAQATDPEAKTVLSGLADAAGPMAQLEGTAVDIRDVVVEAAKAAVNAKRKGLKLADFARTRDMTMPADTQAVVDFLAENIRSARRIGDGLRAAAQFALDNQGGSDMFGDVPPASRTDVVNQLRGQDDTRATQSDANPGRGEPAQVDAGRDGKPDGQGQQGAGRGPEADAGQGQGPAPSEDLDSLFDEALTAATTPKTPADAGVSVSATKESNDGTQAPEAQQARPQQPPKERGTERQVSKKTGNVKTSYDVWDDEGNKGTINIIRKPDGEVFRIFQEWTNKDGKTARFEMSTGYGKGTDDDYIVKAIAEPGDLSLTKPQAPEAEQAKTQGQEAPAAPTVGPQGPAMVALQKQKAKRDALQAFKKSLDKPAPKVTASIDGKDVELTPMPLTKEQKAELLELADSALDAGVPAKLLQEITASGSLPIPQIAGVNLDSGAFYVGNGWDRKTKQERYFTFLHEMGHLMDPFEGDVHAFTSTKKWDAGFDEMRKWYESNGSATLKLAYPFHKHFDGLDKRSEAFAQAVGFYFSEPVETAANVPSAYLEISQIIKGVNDGSVNFGIVKTGRSGKTEGNRQALSEGSAGTSNDTRNSNGNGPELPLGGETSELAKPVEGLTSPTPDQIRATEEAKAAAERAEKAAKAADEARAKLEQERKEIAQRSEAAADTFELGQDAMANLTGQKDIFGEGQSQPKTESPKKQQVKTVRDVADEMGMEYVSGVFVSSLKKGQTFTMLGKEYTVTAVTDSRVRFKTDDGKNIEGRKFGSTMAGNDKYSQFVRDMEGVITVDLVNENNPFHKKSEVFNLTQAAIDAMPDDMKTIKGQSQPKTETKPEASSQATPASQTIDPKNPAIPAYLSLPQGTIISDASGKKYRVHYTRFDLIVSHPIVNGRAEVNADSSVRFRLRDDRAPDSAERGGPVYLEQLPEGYSLTNGKITHKTEKQAGTIDEFMENNAMDRWEQDLPKSRLLASALHKAGFVNDAQGQAIKDAKNLEDMVAAINAVIASNRKGPAIDATLQSMYEALDGRGLKKTNAEKKLAKLGGDAQLVQDRFLDILQDLEDSGKLKINC